MWTPTCLSNANKYGASPFLMSVAGRSGLPNTVLQLLFESGSWIYLKMFINVELFLITWNSVLVELLTLFVLPWHQGNPLDITSASVRLRCHDLTFSQICAQIQKKKIYCLSKKKHQVHCSYFVFQAMESFSLTCQVKSYSGPVLKPPSSTAPEVPFLGKKVTAEEVWQTSCTTSSVL